MKKKRKLLISFGKLEDEDSTWDIAFWQSVDTEERFKATEELIKEAYELQTGTPLKSCIDRTKIESGKYSDD